MMDLTTVEGLTAWRKRKWRGNIREDGALVEGIARRILASVSMRREVTMRPYLLIEAVMQVVDKSQRVVPFFLNEVQRRFLEAFEQNGTARPYYVLKGRQQGFTTLITAMQLCYCLARKNFAGFTLADNVDNVNAIFADKAKAMYDRLPAALKPHAKYNSRRELTFDRLGSSWRVGAAGDNLGRSRTLHFVHYSEVAFYRCKLEALQRSLGEALTPESVQIYETTANGYNNAKDLWDSGSCVNLFFAWWQTPEYVADSLPESCDKWLSARLAWLEKQGVDSAHRYWYARKYRSYLDKSGVLQEYPCTADEAWVTSTDCYFDRDLVLGRLACKQQPLRVGYFACDVRYSDLGETLDNVRWVDDEAGCVRLYEMPAKRVAAYRAEWAPYAIGGDTAGEGSDWYAAVVVNAASGHTAATLHWQNTDDDLYARQIYCLGLFYNEATVGLEVNFSLAPTRSLQKWGYPHLYMRERMDSLSGKCSLRAGFCTNAQTRPVILSNLKALFREDPTIEGDRDTLLEMLSFVKNGAGRPEAAGGKHDDLVMSLAIAHHVAEYMGREWVESPTEDSDWISRHFHCE